MMKVPRKEAGRFLAQATHCSTTMPADRSTIGGLEQNQTGPVLQSDRTMISKPDPIPLIFLVLLARQVKEKIGRLALDVAQPNHDVVVDLAEIIHDGLLVIDQ